MDITPGREPKVAEAVGESPVIPKKAAAKKKVIQLAAEPTASSGSQPIQSIPKTLVPKIAQLLSKRDTLKRDKAWLSSSNSAMTAIGAARDGQQLLLSHDDPEDILVWSRDEVQVVQESLIANGLSAEENVSVGAMACLLEQARRYALEVLADAHDFASHRHTQVSAHPLQAITPADIALAVDFKAGHDVAAAIPSLQGLAEEINRVPLPPIPTHCYNGIVLPDRHHQLTARTFDVISSKRVQERMNLGGNFPSINDTNKDPVSQDHPSKKRRKSAKETNNTSVYGITKGKQIPVHFKVDDQPTSLLNTELEQTVPPQTL